MLQAYGAHTIFEIRSTSFLDNQENSRYNAKTLR